MYHCHFEDVEHIQMGMTGVIFVRPRQNQGATGIPVARSAGGPASSPLGYVYNDGVAPGQARSTAYDREFVIFLTEVWADAHWRDAHIQVSDWSDYAPDYWLMNGRVYPDTIEPNYDPMVTPTATPAGDSPAERLQFQPISSLVKANAQERVLLRFVNLGYRQAAMTLPGLPMRVVGKDATLLRGRDGTDNSYLTNTVYVGPGESTDAIFTAQNTGTYRLYNRDYAYLSNAGASGLGGQLTEIRISAANSLPLQTVPQT
jgi:FtsP/CotA-like multicopper oxidase with cupredoxin domain